jgi:predicted MFS family arabinose efflux permease
MKSNVILTRFQVILMAIAAGASVANIYYNQPILREIAISLDVNDGKAGMISMLTQIGYGLGLFFITPLGDKISRKRLIIILLSLLDIVLLLMFTAVNIIEVWVLSILIGILSVSVHVILPMAASLDSGKKGKTLGTIFSGILIGILAARLIGGFVAQWLGWRYVYGLSALFVLSITLMLRANLPDSVNGYQGHYLQLLKSALNQFRRFSLLRQTALAGGLLFGLFCTLWTTLTFHLSGPPFNFHPGTISLFGLVAFAGALIAPAFGRLADRGNSPVSLLLSILMIFAGLIFLKITADSLITLTIAMLILNIGLPANQVTNLSIIYTLDQSSNSRINTIYMTTYFVGGALGTFLGLICWKLGGWDLVTWEMVLLALAAGLIILKSIKELGTLNIGTRKFYLR